MNTILKDLESFNSFSEKIKSSLHEICPWYKYFWRLTFPFIFKYHGKVLHALVKYK